ncbi:MAG: response regulator [Deltaproteobacteria bacterium]|nr:response regulator [Deltaproteobacteria bacterium]
MTDPVLLLAVSFQYLAAFLAFRLIRVSGSRRSWGFISLAILLMALRHTVSYFFLLIGGRPPMDLRTEWVTLLSALCMVFGVALIGPLFRSMECSREKLKASERRYRNIFNLATVSIWEEDFHEVLEGLDRLKAEGVTDFRAWFRGHPERVREAVEKTKVLDVNPATLALYGAENKAELLGSPQKVFTPESFSVFEEILIALAEGRKAFSADAVMQTLQGERREVYLSLSVPPEVSQDGKLLITIMDITERKRMEEEQQRIGKLESLGVLAGGIAHDFNNLLTAILGNINILKKESQPGTLIFERAEKAEKASLQAKGLTRQLLTFARGSKPAKRTASLKQVIRDAVEFALTGTNVKAEFSVAGDLWFADVDVDQIGQVMNNLALNAVQAMPEGGCIRVGASNVTEAPGDLAPGRYIQIIVTDEGLGIAGKDLHRIFDPYFSTREQGSGLGLASVYSIIHRHGGCVTVDSVEGEGATFKVYLPASSKHARTVRDRKEREWTGRGRILVMDDEAFVLDVAGNMLSKMGFEVVYAKDGGEAVALFRKGLQEGRPFAAVIMDLTIPGGMGGRETQDCLRRIDPGVKTIVSSGYSDDPILSQYQDYGFQGILLKPYRLAEMSEVLRSVLGR